MLCIKLNIYGKVGAMKAPKVQDLIKQNLDGSMLTVFKIGFFSEALPCIKKLDWKKVIIGDNLSAHINKKVIKACQQNLLSFISLPPNSTYLKQPLGITFFWSVKSNWKEEWINKNKFCTTKGSFSIYNWRNYILQWQKTQPVILQKFPQKREDTSLASKTFLGILSEMKTKSNLAQNQNRKKRVNIKPGKRCTTWRHCSRNMFRWKKWATRWWNWERG